MLFKNIRIKPWIKKFAIIAIISELGIFLFLSINIIGMGLNLLFTPILSDMAGIFFGEYILGILITVGITTFVSKYGSKIQLVYELTRLIALLAIIPGLISLSVIFIHPNYD